MVSGWVGVATASTIISVARRMAARKESAALIVHSLLGHSADFVAALAKAAQTAANYWWLHDYFSICPNYTLLRNGASFCGAPPVSSLACNICCFGDDRRFQGQRIQRLFEDVSFSVLSPSEVTLDIWKHSSKLPHSSATIVPHCAVSDVIIDRRLPTHPMRQFELHLWVIPRDIRGGRSLRRLSIKTVRVLMWSFTTLGFLKSVIPVSSVIRSSY